MRIGTRRRTLLVLGGLVIVVGLAWYIHHRWEKRFFVYVGVPTSLNRNDDNTVVTATLNEYAHFGTSDETTGKSISFAFPRSLYTFGANARGGAQRRIGISVDRVTLDRVDTSAELANLNQRYMPASNAYVLAYLDLRNLDIRVYTNQYNGFRHNYARIEEARTDRAISPIASFCNLTWYLERDVDGRTSESNPKIPLTSSGPRFGYGASLLATVDGVFVEGEPATAYCNAEGGFCQIYASYEDWPMSFRILREDLCDWPSELNRTRTYLQSHISARTPRRLTQSD